MAKSPDEEQVEKVSKYFILFSALLATTLIFLKKLHDYPWVHAFVSEAALILIIGIFAGFFVRAFIIVDSQIEENADDDGNYVVAKSLISFDSNVFFLALLPPILFNSGYQLRRELFYRHIRPIVMFACIGTAISAVGTSLILIIVEACGLMGDFKPTFLEIFTFGSLIAATDTVSVTAVFQAKKVDPHLFCLVFGESALNDAVALVLFKTFARFLAGANYGVGNIAVRSLGFVFNFLIAAFGSPFLGIVFGFAAALVFKYVDLREHPPLELPLYVLLMYIPFILAEFLNLSGIVAIFFCGMSARRYVSPNVSDETGHNAEVVFKVSAFLAETCIFLELGLSVFGLSGNVRWRFILWAFAATLIARAMSIYPIAMYYNKSLRQKQEGSETMDVFLDLTDIIPEYASSNEESLPQTSTRSSRSMHQVPLPRRPLRSRTPMKRKDKKISFSMMHVMWFAGLRGAVAYACSREFPNVFGHQDEFIAATMVIVLVSIIFMGGGTEFVLRILNIEMNVDEDEYMVNWHKKRGLKGAFHRFERDFIYKIAVREEVLNEENGDIVMHGGNVIVETSAGVVGRTDQDQQHLHHNTAFDYRAESSPELPQPALPPGYCRHEDDISPSRVHV